MKTIIVPIVAFIYLALQIIGIDVKIPQDDVVNSLAIVITLGGIVFNHFKEKEIKE